MEAFKPSKTINASLNLFVDSNSALLYTNIPDSRVNLIYRL